MIRPFTDAVSRLRQRREQAQQRQAQVSEITAESAVTQDPRPELSQSPDLWLTSEHVEQILAANDLADLDQDSECSEPDSEQQSNEEQPQ